MIEYIMLWCLSSFHWADYDGHFNYELRYFTWQSRHIFITDANDELITDWSPAWAISFAIERRLLWNDAFILDFIYFTEEPIYLFLISIYHLFTRMVSQWWGAAMRAFATLPFD